MSEHHLLYWAGMKGERMLTVKEAADRLRTTEVTIRRWIKAGKLRGRMPGGTKLGYLIPESEVERLLPKPAEDLGQRQRLAA
jgi:excisionase family DNA binding protein